MAKSLHEQNIERMDRVCEKLLDLIENENTTDKVKPGLFSQAIQWQKFRKTITHDGTGQRLKEMEDHVKGAKGSGNSDRAKSDQDGSIIRKLIDTLPSQRNRNPSGNQGNSVVTDSSGFINVRVNGTDGGGDVPANTDVPVDRADI